MGGIEIAFSKKELGILEEAVDEARQISIHEGNGYDPLFVKQVLTLHRKIQKVMDHHGIKYEIRAT